MNKTEFLKELKSRCDTDVASMAALSRLMDAGQDIITEALVKGDSVSLTGFGTFVAAKRAEHAGVSPVTGEAITIPAMTVPKFKPGKSFKDAVRNAE